MHRRADVQESAAGLAVESAGDPRGVTFDRPIAASR
jgi:hypothetical protein